MLGGLSSPGFACLTSCDFLLCFLPVAGVGVDGLEVVVVVGSAFELRDDVVGFVGSVDGLAADLAGAVVSFVDALSCCGVDSALAIGVPACVALAHRRPPSRGSVDTTAVVTGNSGRVCRQAFSRQGAG